MNMIPPLLKVPEIRPPLLKVGEIDPATNEKVTYVTEFDEDALKSEHKQQMLCFLPMFIIIGICVPCILIVPLVLYIDVKSTINKAQGTMNYLTDHNFVTIIGIMSGNRRIVRLTNRRIIPLTNIASVTERSAVSCRRPDEIIIDVNLKPTAPPVILHGTRTGAQGSAVYFSYQSHSIPLYYVKNHQAFAEAIKSRITF